MPRWPANIPRHGRLSAYAHGCRCDPCKRAKADYDRGYAHRDRTQEDREAMIANLLHELAPNGLTDDCPARRALGAA